MNEIRKMGFRIALKRRENDLTQEKLAEMLDISPKQISAIENGHSNTNLSTLIKLCKVLNVTPDYLLLGIIRDNEIQNICDSLMLCRDEDLEQINDIINTFIAKNNTH